MNAQEVGGLTYVLPEGYRIVGVMQLRMAVAAIWDARQAAERAGNENLARVYRELEDHLKAIVEESER